MKQDKQRSKTEIESIIKGGQYGSQTEASQYFKQHDLNTKWNDDGSVDILDGSNTNQKLASVTFTGTDDKRSVSNINYTTS